MWKLDIREAENIHCSHKNPQEMTAAGAKAGKSVVQNKTAKPPPWWTEVRNLPTKQRRDRNSIQTMRDWLADLRYEAEEGEERAQQPQSQ